jgi:hypothetical protein
VITETIRFQPAGLTAQKSVRCTSCGKRVRRQRRFEQTLNPYNRLNGYPKSGGQILDEERAKAAEWKQQPEICGTCREAADGP